MLFCVLPDLEAADGRKLSSEAQQERRRQVIRAFWRGVKQRQVACDLGLGYSPVRMIVGRYKKDGPQGMQMGRRGVLKAVAARSLPSKQNGFGA